MPKLSAQRTAHAAERMAVYHLDAPLVGVAKRTVSRHPCATTPNASSNAVIGKLARTIQSGYERSQFHDGVKRILFATNPAVESAIAGGA